MIFFSEESFKFLTELQKNNNKAWFLENKSSYEDLLILPIKELISNLDMFMMTIDVNIETKPVINKAISRIYRDTRYSKNKKPFKDRIGFNFRKKSSEWKYYPALIFRIIPSGYMFGLIVMKNNPDFFLNYRNDIDNTKSDIHKIIKNISLDKELNLMGEKYKKFAYKGKNRRLDEWYSKKNLFLQYYRDKNFYNSKEQLITDIHDKFSNLKPIYNHLNKIFTSDINAKN